MDNKYTYEYSINLFDMECSMSEIQGLSIVAYY